MSDDDFDWPNPWNWNTDHGVVEENHIASRYDVGIDSDGDVLIHYEGHVGTVSGETIANIDRSENPEELVKE